LALIVPIAISSSTNLLSFILELILEAPSFDFSISPLKMLPSETFSKRKLSAIADAMTLAFDPGAPTMKTHIGSFFPSRLIKKSIGFSGRWIKSYF
jgi:hypothetical protein